MIRSNRNCFVFPTLALTNLQELTPLGECSRHQRHVSCWLYSSFLWYNRTTDLFNAWSWVRDLSIDVNVNWFVNVHGRVLHAQREQLHAVLCFELLTFLAIFKTTKLRLCCDSANMPLITASGHSQCHNVYISPWLSLFFRWSFTLDEAAASHYSTAPLFSLKCSLTCPSSLCACRSNCAYCHCGFKHGQQAFWFWSHVRMNYTCCLSTCMMPNTTQGSRSTQYMDKGPHRAHSGVVSNSNYKKLGRFDLQTWVKSNIYLQCLDMFLATCLYQLG